MEKYVRALKSIAFWLLMASFAGGLAGCQVLADAVTTTPIMGVSYTAPVIPVKIAYNFAMQKATITLDESVTTPVGRFAVSGGVGTEIRKTESGHYTGVKTLVVIVANDIQEKTLDPKREYSFTLPSDASGKTSVLVKGDRMTIRIPDPIAESPQSLKDALEAAKRAREEAEEERWKAEEQKEKAEEEASIAKQESWKAKEAATAATAANASTAPSPYVPIDDPVSPEDKDKDEQGDSNTAPNEKSPIDGNDQDESS